MKDGLQYPIHRLILKLIGTVLLLVGGLSAFLGPLEMFCFYLFSEGGRFHYEGFGFGAFMFGNLAAQILGYYFIAAFLLPLGYGTVKLRSWARHLTLAALRFWSIAGMPLILAFFFVLVSSKEVTLPFAILVGALLVTAYLALPRWVTRFYDSTTTRLIFERQGGDKTWIETVPPSVLGLGYVCVFFGVILHVHIFFNGIFPLFGVWKSGLEGIFLIDIAIVGLGLVLWGMLRIQKWAWWAGLAYFSLMAGAYLTTLGTSSWADILSTLNLPTFERELLQSIPLQGYHFAILVSIPFILTLDLIIRAKPDFKS